MIGEKIPTIFSRFSPPTALEQAREAGEDGRGGLVGLLGPDQTRDVRVRPTGEGDWEILTSGMACLRRL